MSKLRIPYPTEGANLRKITPQQWGVLVNSTFPGATNADAILNAWDLAQVKRLDIFGGHVAIVTQRRQVDGNWISEESSWLTLKALVYTAHRTGQFAGIDPITLGPVVEKSYEGYTRNRGGANDERNVKIKVPEYVTATVYRFVNGERCAFSDTIFFDEMVSISQGVPTAIWAKKPALMLAKCAKAAALRLGFAECDYSADEMEGQEVIADLVPDGSGSSVVNLTTDEGSVKAPDGANMQLESEHSASGGGLDQGLQGVDPFAGAGFGEAVTSFDKMPAKTLKWLDRSYDAAVNLGSYDQVIDNLKTTLDAEYHPLGTKLIRSAQTIATSNVGKNLLNYISQARQHGGAAFDTAIKTIAGNVQTGRVSQEEADASQTVLTFMKVLTAA